ncbi:MAG: acylneuraminate cytidylyltransferase [Myxococcales bacterium]|nr:acylneuraminate cytidylyltransferase [Myxococcales bacterium]
MKRVVIIQARMTSTRLPGKVLRDLAGRPMLAQQIARLRRCQAIDALCLATTINATDDPVAALGAEEGVTVHRGDEHDVLARYLGAAAQCQADVVVRITADCPLIDPAILDAVVATLLATPCDYASNTLTRTYPRGLDVEAFHVDVLRRMARLATSPMAREHVTYFLHRERPELFLHRELTDTTDNSDLRWTVDTEDDLALVRRIYQEAGLPDRFGAYPDLVALVRRSKELSALNAHVRQATP